MYNKGDKQAYIVNGGKVKSDKITALLCRLSKEDEIRGDSESIQTQKKMLLQYAKKYEFNNIEFYVDDGYSGTNFDRPDFKRLMNDIDKGIVGIVIVKDLSRLGREYIEVGTLIEKVFPNKGVRFIAINDDVDSMNGIPEYIPFKNIMNEWYAKDISKKIRSAYRTKALNGEYTGAYAPYGYIKDPKDKHHLIIDLETSIIVKRIFNMAVEGLSAYEIAKVLTNEKILKPRAKVRKDTGKYDKEIWNKYPYDWRPQTIYRIISNEEYLGHLVCNRNSTKSFKTKKLLPVDKKDWIKTLNTHEAIIDEETFLKANQIFTRIKHRPLANNTRNIFSGLLRCSICGKALSVHNDKRSNSNSFCCVTYRTYGKEYCSSHYIRYDLLYSYVLNDINSSLKSFWKDNDKFIDSLKKEYLSNNIIKTNNLDKELNKINLRLNELDRITKKLYEDYALSKIKEEMFNKLMNDYELESRSLNNARNKLLSELNTKSEKEKSIERFINIIKKYEYITELDPIILNELISKIIIYDKYQENGIIKQKIEIHYRFIGE